MRAIVESQFAANLVLAEQDIADRFLRKLLIVGNNSVNTTNTDNESAVDKVNIITKIDSSQINAPLHASAARGTVSSATLSRLSKSTSSPQLLKELFEGLNGLDTLASVSSAIGSQNIPTSPAHKSCDINSSGEETIFDSIPDYGKDDMYSDLSDDDSLEEVFASLVDVESFTNESKTVNTTGAVVADIKNSPSSKKEVKKTIVTAPIATTAPIAPDHRLQSSLSILSPSSFRDHMLQIRKENDNIRDDILRFRSTLKLLKDETECVYDKPRTLYVASSARL